jgi:epoxyqueuosine reductase
MRRNAVIAMANSGDPSFFPVLNKLMNDDDQVVREAAAWAVKKIKRAS